MEILIILKDLSGCECEYYDKPMKLDECQKERDQIKVIHGIEVNEIGFISSSGFTFNEKEYKLISGKDLFDI